MLITVSSTEGRGQARAPPQGAAGSSPFAGESEAERALSEAAGPLTHAGLPL